jgi:hypothetical protein
LNAAGKVVDLTSLGYPDTMNGIIAGGPDLLSRIAGALADGSLPTSDLGALEFDCVTQPQKIVCVGLNYRNHAAETGAEIPTDIVLFSKFNDALTPAGKSVRLPEWLRCYDYEAELVIVIGKPAWNVPARRPGSTSSATPAQRPERARQPVSVSQWLAGKSLPALRRRVP